MRRVELILLAAIVIGVVTNLLILDLATFRSSLPAVPVTTPSPLPSAAPVTPTPFLPPIVTTPHTSSVPVKTSVTTLESYVPLGAGSTQNDQWEDIAGTDVTLDTANYGKLKTVYLEASLSIPTKNGTVYARLYNVTDKHPVWYSDISTGSDQSLTLQSPAIVLSPGIKTYRVQMKTTMRYQSLLNQARLRILSVH